MSTVEDRNVIDNFSFVKNDKELQKEIWKMHLKSEDMIASYILLGSLLLVNIFLIVLNPKVFIPITIAEILIEIFFIFKKSYTMDVYEVKEIYKSTFSSNLKYIECILAKPENKKIDGYIKAKIIKSRNEIINIEDKVIAIKIGNEIIVTKCKN